VAEFAAKRWLTFLRNHREAIAAMDFFTVPTLTFGVLNCFFVIGHDRRKILHFNATQKPNAVWIAQQLREAWAYKQPNRFLLFDRDSKCGVDVVSVVRDMGSQPTRTAFRSPWQNGVAERWVARCRRDLLDHMAPLNENERREVWEICEDRCQTRSTALTSQLPISRWHEQIGDPTIADGILDRLVHNAHPIEMRGESMRKNRNPPQDEKKE